MQMGAIVLTLCRITHFQVAGSSRRNRPDQVWSWGDFQRAILTLIYLHMWQNEYLTSWKYIDCKICNFRGLWWYVGSNFGWQFCASLLICPLFKGKPSNSLLPVNVLDIFILTFTKCPSDSNIIWSASDVGLHGLSIPFLFPFLVSKLHHPMF